MNQGNKGLMVVDMQEGFLNNFFSKKESIRKLVDNTCDLISDAVKRKKKIFVVEFDEHGDLNTCIQKALPPKYIEILKGKPYFPMLEVPGSIYGVTYDEFDGIEEIDISGVDTNFCVREAYRTVKELGINPSLVLGCTLNTPSTMLSLSYLRQFYIQENGISPNLLGEEEGKTCLEDYL